MYILMNELCRQLNGFSQILIYGAGDYANVIYSMLKKAGLKEKICSFIVTDENGINDIDGIPVRLVKEIKSFNLEECVVLIAVSLKYEQAIMQTLQKLHIVNIVKLMDYKLSEDELRDTSDVQFLRYIREYYVWNTINSLEEFENISNIEKKRMEQRDIRKVDRDTIVFISGDLTPRVVKIIGALLRKKYKIVVLEYGGHTSIAKLLLKELLSYKVAICHCQDIADVYCRAMQYNPLVYYFVPLWGDCSGAEIMIRHKKLFGKIVIGLYDVVNEGYAYVSDEQRRTERYSLENADGIVWRWFSKESLEKRGFVYSGKSIQFLDYCAEYEVEKAEEQRTMLKLCFASGAAGAFLDKNRFKNDGHYVEYATIDNIMKKIGKREDCLFHVFSATRDKKAQFDILEEEYPNFKVFYETNHEDFIRKISDYDYGCMLCTGGKEEFPDKMMIVNGSWYGNVYRNAMVNRYFDYINAGIPIIATRPEKLCNYLEKFEVIVKMDISNMNIDYLKKNKEFLKEKAQKARKKLLIDNYIQELIDFFESLYD